MAKLQTIEKLKKAIAVLESDHIAQVEVRFRGTFNDVRYYDAITWNGRHKYTVRVQDWFENGELQRWAKCTCKANALDRICRHIIKVSEIDADMLGRDLWLESFADYGVRNAPARRMAA